MAEIQKKEEQTPIPSYQIKKRGGMLHSVLVILLSLLVVLVVSTGVFYFAVKNNINGIADTLRPNFISHPILRLFLPKEQEPVDPDAPQYLSDKELLKKYEEYRAKVKELNLRLTEADNTIAQLEKEIKGYNDSKAILEENKTTLERISQEQSELDSDKEILSQMIVKGDKDGFKEYFEKIDKISAKSIYEKVLIEDAKAQDKKALAKPFESMEPRSAAIVLTELFNRDNENAVDIFEGMKNDVGGLILEQMEPSVAAQITQMLSDRKFDRYSID